MKEKILVVDDDLNSIEHISILLRSKGYNVKQCLDGTKVIEELESFTPDMILLDIVMPNISGYDICEEIKDDIRYSEIPVMFISGLSDHEEKIKGFEVGGVDYVNKPYNVYELSARIKTHLRIKRLQRNLKNKVNENETLLRIMSHDLANIFNAVGGYAELGELFNKDNAKNLKYFSAISKQTERANELVNSVKEMTAIDSGKVELVLEQVSIAMIINNAKDTFYKKLNDKNLTLKTIPEVIDNSMTINAEPISFQ
ncbi:MAG: response regulator, partial [Candidatus Cloacimonadota bacterium]|nr:response regulator [Candidatus Cloacimonadota bacterium]